MSSSHSAHSYKTIFLLIGLVLLAAACMEEASKQVSKSPEEILADSLTNLQVAENNRLSNLREDLENADLYHCGADNISVRQEPSMASAEIDLLSAGEALRFAGEVGGDSTGIMIGDHVSIDQFALVLTARGQIGWIHKGALKK